MWKSCGKMLKFEAKFLNFLEDMTICTIIRHLA